MGPERQLVWSKRLHWEKYFSPKTILEALNILKEFDGRAKVIAGGTDVLLQIRNREIAPQALVDITAISGLDEIKLNDGFIRIGALVTHSQVVKSRLIQTKALALGEGASWLGSPQIRNLGTVAGNIVSGQPGADTTIPLLALDASVKVVSPMGERTIPFHELFVDIGKTLIDSTKEIVTEIFFPVLGETQVSLTLRLARRKALALPILTVAMVLSADLTKRRFREVRIALGPVAPVPMRPKEAETLLASSPITDEVIQKAALKASQESNPRTSLLRGSEDYRRAMIANLVERGIRKGIERLEGRNV